MGSAFANVSICSSSKLTSRLPRSSTISLISVVLPTCRAP